jgi:hypothetical protein
VEDFGGPEDVDECGSLGAVDEAADDTAQVEVGPGAAGVVGGFGAKEILLQEGDLGGRGLDRCTDLVSQDRACGAPIEASESIQGALDEDAERNGLFPREGSAVGEQVGRAQEVDGDGPRRHEGLRSEAEKVGGEIGRQSGEVRAPEGCGGAVGMDAPESGDPKRGAVSRAEVLRGASEAGEDPGVVAPAGTVKGDLDVEPSLGIMALRYVKRERWPAGEAGGVEDAIGAGGGETAELLGGRRRGLATLALGVATGFAKGTE